MPIDQLEVPSTIDEAKEYACNYAVRWLSEDELLQRIEAAKITGETAPTDNLRDYWQTEVLKLRELLDSKEYREGDFHQSVDQLLFELIEWRAMFYAIQQSETSVDPFKQHVFLQQWSIGGVHTMYSILAKLVDSNNKTRSLFHLWKRVSGFIEKETGSEEVQFLSRQIAGKDRIFSNEKSEAIRFRNKVIAHNEKSHSADLSNLDNDIQILARIWSVITTWSSFGVIEPWRDAQTTFSGLNLFYGAADLLLLQSNRQSYLNKVETWCRTNVCTKTYDARSPYFSSFSVTASITPNEGSTTQ